MNTSLPQTRKELARLYEVSDKTFSTMLRRHELNFGPARVLTPKQISQVIQELGHWRLNDPDYAAHDQVVIRG